MESQKVALDIFCPLHPSEKIQRVSLNTNTEHHIYCLECILIQDTQNGSQSQTLKTFSELIDAVASLYVKKRENIKFGEQVPFEMAEILSGQTQELEQLTQHIGQEKKRVSLVFEALSEEFLKALEEKKKESFNKLDQQIFNLQFCYHSFEKQLKKTFPTPEDIPILYPTREDLLAKLGKIANATQLTALVKSLKEDLNETSSPEDVKAQVHKMSKELLNLIEKRPTYQGEDFNIEKLKENLREKLSALVNEVYQIEDSIKRDLTDSMSDSVLIKEKDFDLIKSWLPKNLLFSPKLLFRASRDGMTGPDFHRLCDNKSNTISLIKAQFSGSSQTTIIGGYLDKTWNSSNAFIYSTDSFIFSISKKIKCSLMKGGEEYAGSGKPHQGPSFGFGHDLTAWSYQGESYVYPNSYEDSHQLIESPDYFEERALMDVLEVEVYSLN